MTPPARTAEHDAFGPWIDTVRTLDEVPRLFRPYGADPFSARLVLKVPRDIARRDTDPTMDLYDHLIVVRDHELEVLSRRGSTFVARRVPYADVVAVRDRVDLLDGLLTLHTVDGSALEIPFNGASADVVVDLTELLVDLAGAAEGVPVYAPGRAERVAPRIDMGQDEAGIASAYYDLTARDPQLRYLSSHPRIRLRADATGALGLLRRLRPMSLAGALAAYTPHELLVISRRDPVLRRRTATLSIDRLRILRHAITSTTSEPHPRWEGMSVVTIRAGAAAFEIVTETTTAMECDLLTVSR